MGSYSLRMELAKMLVLTIAVVIGLPLAIVGLTLLGPVGWIVAAIVVPVGALAAIIFAARPRARSDD
jgi:hypothetical protein